jgi:hypothetical protein
VSKGEPRRIVLLVEGATEIALKPVLKSFLDHRCEAEDRPRVRLDMLELDSRLLKERLVRDLVARNIDAPGVLGVVALIDVVCSGRPKQFDDAGSAIEFLTRAASTSNPRFRAHAAQFDLEAWLLPYWTDICRRVGKRQASPGPHPEAVNHGNPPSRRLRELYRTAGKHYDKPRDALAILRDKDLSIAAAACPNLRALLVSLLELSGCSAPV